MQTISFRIDMWNDWSDDDDDEDLERRRWSVSSRRESRMPRTIHLGALDNEPSAVAGFRPSTMEPPVPTTAAAAKPEARAADERDRTANGHCGNTTSRCHLGVLLLLLTCPLVDSMTRSSEAKLTNVTDTWVVSNASIAEVYGHASGSDASEVACSPKCASGGALEIARCCANETSPRRQLTVSSPFVRSITVSNDYYDDDLNEVDVNYGSASVYAHMTWFAVSF